MKIHFASFLLFSSFFLFESCSNNSVDSSTNTTVFTSASALPVCKESSELENVMVYVTDSSQFWYCDGSEWQKISQQDDDCSVSVNNNIKTISCSDGTSIEINNGINGANGTNGTNGMNGSSCSATDNGNGSKTITCTDGTSISVNDGTNGTNGTNGSSCSVTDNGNGSKTIACADGTSIAVNDGTNGATGANGTNGSNGTNGTSIEWLGSLSATPSSPTVNQAYYNIAENVSYIWSGTAWSILVNGNVSHDDIRFPDGLDGQAIVSANYVVPTGKTLYITSYISQVTINGAAILLNPTIDRPSNGSTAIAKSGSTVATSSNAFTGILVDESAEIINANSYVVPIGKTLIVTSHWGDVFFNGTRVLFSLGGGAIAFAPAGTTVTCDNSEIITGYLR